MASDTDKVRAIIGDDETPYMFTDEQIENVLDATEDSVFLTVAILLERIAGEHALLYSYVKTNDITVSGDKAAAIILSRANYWRGKAEKDDLADAFYTTYPPQVISARHGLEYGEPCL